MAPKDSGKSSQRRASPPSRGGKKSENRQPEQKKSRPASKQVPAVEPLTAEAADASPTLVERGKRKRDKAAPGAGAAPQPATAAPARTPEAEEEALEVTLSEAPQVEEEVFELDEGVEAAGTGEAELEAGAPQVVVSAPTSRGERRAAHANALGLFIERQFAKKESPCHSYSDLERHSNISREALSRYVTSRADRRRAPTIDTMVAIADALRVSLEGVARAAAASVTGVVPPPEDVQKAREEALGALVAPLSDAQFNAVAELLRQMRPEREK